MKKKISVIIPFLNEQENIPALVAALNDYFGNNNAFSAEIIFVNDGSTDNSLHELRTAQHRSYASRIISLSRNFGSHAALRAGISKAGGDYITFMYADLQDPVDLVQRMFDECEKKHDITWAVRKSTDNGIFNTIFSKFYSFMMRRFAVKTYPEKGFDIVMFSQKVQKLLNSNTEANSSVFLQILTFGFRQTTIEYDKQARKKGKSKWTLSKKIKLFIDSFVAFSYAPIRFVTLLGFAMFFIGIAWSAYLILRKLLVGDLASGWPALVSILLIGFGITNISLGIIAEYLWRNLDASRKRPVYIIDEEIEIESYE